MSAKVSNPSVNLECCDFGGLETKKAANSDCKLAALDFDCSNWQRNKVYFCATLYILHAGKGAHARTALQIVDDHLKHVEDQEDDNR